VRNRGRRSAKPSETDVRMIADRTAQCPGVGSSYSRRVSHSWRAAGHCHANPALKLTALATVIVVVINVALVCCPWSLLVRAAGDRTPAQGLQRMAAAHASSLLIAVFAWWGHHGVQRAYGLAPLR